MTRLVKVLTLIVLAGATVSATAIAIPPDARISTAGLGPIKIGMTAKQVERANHRPVRRGDETDAGDCSLGRLGKKVVGLFTGDRLARIYVRTRRYPTRSGVRVGDTEQDVYDTYPGRVVTEPHKYTPDGHELEFIDGNRKVVFETDGRRVVSISTGRRPEIDYVEACS